MTASYRRIELREADDVLIVTFVDRKILDESNIQTIGQELFSLVDEEKHTKFVLSFRAVEYMSSAMHGKLIAFDKKVNRAGSRLALYGIRPDLYEVFSITKMNRIYHIFDSEEEALSWINTSSRLIQCPVDECREYMDLHTPARDLWVTIKVKCPACGSQLELQRRGRWTGESPKLEVKELCFTTYEGESIRITFPLLKSQQATAPPVTVRISSRLDLFASEILERAVRTIPNPRSLLFDLREMSDISDVGAERLLKLAGDNEDDECRSVILLTEAQQQAIPLLSENRAVQLDEESAAAVLNIATDRTKPISLEVQFEPDVD